MCDSYIGADRELEVPALHVAQGEEDEELDDEDNIEMPDA